MANGFPDVQVPVEELETVGYWLRKFRRAKSTETLAHMFLRAEERHQQTTSIVASIYLAECQRSRELETGTIMNR